MQSLERLSLVSMVEKSTFLPCLETQRIIGCPCSSSAGILFWSVLVLDFDLVACEKNYYSISASPFYSTSASPLSKHKTRTFLLGWCWMTFNN
jgi:hypothetical protein